MQTITVTEITETGAAEALAAAEELEATGRLTNSADAPLTVTDDDGAELTGKQAATMLRQAL